MAEGEPQAETKVAAEEGQEKLTEAEKNKIAEKIGKVGKVTPKNIKGLLDVMGGIFGLNKKQAESAAVVGDVIIGNAAKRAGISKDEMYQKIAYQKAQMKDLPKGIKFQVDAWHGSPHTFDKFTTKKMGTGEGVQAFGWGLYFTDLESIAKEYAKNLTPKEKYSFEGIDNIDNISTHPMTKSFIKDMLKANPTSRKDAINWVENNSKGKSEKVISELMAFAKILNVDNSVTRNVYKVSLHKGKTPNQYTWLEWDKPVSSKISKLIEGKIKSDIRVEKKTFRDGSIEFVILNNKSNNVLARISDVKTEQDAIQKYNKDFGFKSNQLTGQRLYSDLISELGDNKQASLFLLENGIDGIKYPAESIARGATSDNARGFNYVVFDENAVSIEEVIKFQKDAMKARGAMMMAMDNQAIIYALTDPNVSTPLHELAHVYEHYLTDTERKAIESWSGHKAGTVEFSEAFARGFEKFLAEGKISNPKLQKIFENFKEWLTEIYNGIIGSDIDIELNDTMKGIYNNMLAEDVNTEGKEKVAPKTAKEKLREKFGTTSPKFSKGKPSIQEVIDFAKEEGISKKDLRESLKEEGYSDAAIKEALPRPQVRPPSARRVLGQPKPKKVTVQEMAALKDQIRLEARAARGAVSFINKIRRDIQSAIEGLQKIGKLSTKQVNSITNKLNKVNLLNPIMRERFIDYMEKVYNNAEYAAKLSQARATRAKVKKKIKSEGTDAVLGSAAKVFAKVDPSMVDDIDAYNEVADKVLSGLSSSRVGGSLRSAFDIDGVLEYANKKIEEQDKAILNKLKETFEEITGTDPKDMTYAEMMSLLEVAEDDNAKFSKGKPSIQEMIDFAKEEGISKKDLREFLKEEGYSDAAIKEALPRPQVRPPSARRVLGQPKPKKVTVQEMAALKDQIRLEARAARGAVSFINKIRRDIQSAIEGLQKIGKLSTKQVNSITNKLNKVNLLNPGYKG
jgi:hypothetical protein